MSFHNVDDIEHCITKVAKFLTEKIFVVLEEEVLLEKIATTQGIEGGVLETYNTCLTLLTPLFLKQDVSPNAQANTLLVLMGDADLVPVLTKSSLDPSAVHQKKTSSFQQKLIKQLQKQNKKDANIYYSLPSGRDHEAKQNYRKSSAFLAKIKDNSKDQKSISQVALRHHLAIELSNIFEQVSRSNQCLQESIHDLSVSPTTPMSLRHHPLNNHLSTDPNSNDTPLPRSSRK